MKETDKIPCKQVICECLMEEVKNNDNITLLCSDSRGSASMAPFASAYPENFIETGIAEQNIVSIAAGLARCGKQCYVASPACFLSTRSMEQAKVDVAYSNTNVKLVGISGGVSYGALGMTHHSANDIAALGSIPGMRVYLPSDRFLTKRLMAELMKDNMPAYIRVGRNPVADVYEKDVDSFVMNRAVEVRQGNDITFIACGEMVAFAVEAADILKEKGIFCRVLDMYCVKPIDEEGVLKAARETKGIISIEEHSKYGGLGSIISCITAEKHPAKVMCLSLPDSPAVSGNSAYVFKKYGIDSEGIIKAAAKMLGEE